MGEVETQVAIRVSNLVSEEVCLVQKQNLSERGGERKVKENMEKGETTQTDCWHVNRAGD